MADNHNPTVTVLPAALGYEAQALSGRMRVSIWSKINPVFWFGNDVDPVAPDWFKPGQAEWWRALLWQARNPLANFMAYVIGVKDYDYTICGKYPISEGTPADVGLTGWKWSLISMPFGLRWFVAVAAIACASAAAWLSAGVLSVLATAIVLAYFAPFALLRLPCVAYAGSSTRFYFGWRWEGSFGAKFNIVGSAAQAF